MSVIINWETAIVSTTVFKFLEKEIMAKFISNVLLRLRKDESFCTTLNLKDLNTFITFHYFKMDSIHTCSQLIRPHCFMMSTILCLLT